MTFAPNPALKHIRRPGAAAAPRRRHAWRGWIMATCLAAGGASALAQTVVQPAPQNVLNLSAEASAEVTQDQLTLVLAVVREGSDAAAVQAQVRQALESALAEARKAARPRELEVRTGAFHVGPRYAPRAGGSTSIAGWTGRAELVLEGRDASAIGQLAGRLSGLVVQQVGFGLSREAREQAEARVAAQAIARFREQAQQYAQAFGFGSYSLREVSVNHGQSGMPPVTMVAMRSAKSVSAAVAEDSQPLEAGKTTVSVSVSGSVQLSPR